MEQRYSRNYRGRVDYAHLLMSQKAKPLSLRSFNEIFEAATAALSDEDKKSLLKQGLHGVSCNDLRHTSAVVPMKRYQDAGLDVDKAQEKLRVFFGWLKTSNMPRLYPPSSPPKPRSRPRRPWHRTPKPKRRRKPPP